MTMPAEPRTEPRTHPTNYGPCTAQGCANQAAGRCPGCGMTLCAVCLARHARYPGAGYFRRYRRDDEAEQEAEQAEQAEQQER